MIPTEVNYESHFSVIQNNIKKNSNQVSCMETRCVECLDEWSR